MALLKGITRISLYIFYSIISISAKVHVNSEWKGPRSGRGRERSCLREEREEVEGEGKKWDGRAKNRQRLERKEGTENEGELRSASESPEASRSALSRWISSGQHRSLSFSLSPPYILARLSTTSLTGTRRWRGRNSPLSPLVSAPAAERPCLHRTTSWWGVESTARLPPGASFAHNDRDEREKKKGEDGVLLLLPRRAISRVHPRANRNDSPIRIYIYFNMFM